jgi:beta-lactamase superfamily II metal-dependent hydrolase
MGNKLLVRAYNVGCGDCIYVRIPNQGDGYHILIDCGKKGDDVLLQQAVEHLARNELPNAGGGKRRLDLIVATHRHEDHIKGFDTDWFKNIQVRNIWLSAVMDPNHKQAGNVQKLHAFAGQVVKSIKAQGLALSPDLELLTALYGVSNDAADECLMKVLPKANNIQPRYVHAGMSSKKDLGLDLGDATIHVLGPEEDIDHYYLGEEADKTLHAMQGLSRGFAAKGVPATADQRPANISASDFRCLQTRLLSNALGFAEKDTEIQNNMSVVLLIEWSGRRLLFVGDAEWNGEFRDGKQNGSWNVMWEKRHAKLNTPVDFLKIGHHGSINATPPPPEAGKATGASSVKQILDAILPLPKAGKMPTAQAIVSTEREFYDPIPEAKLLVELGNRVANTKNYRQALKAKGIAETDVWITTKAKKNNFYSKYEKNFLGMLQPLRTDLENLLEPGKGYVEVVIAPK